MNWKVFSLLLALALGLYSCSGGFKQPGNMCEQSSDCTESLECMQTAQGDPKQSCTGIIQPKLCTKACSSDSDCASLGLRCSVTSSCGAHVDRCGN